MEKPAQSEEAAERSDPVTPASTKLPPPPAGKAEKRKSCSCSQRFAALLWAEKVPFGLGIFVALVGWGLTHLVDRFVKTPTLEYECQRLREGGREYAACLIRNISTDTVFRGLEFVIWVPEPKGQPGATLLTGRPWIDWLDTTPPGEEEPTRTARDARYTVPRLDPGNEVWLKVQLLGAAEFRLRVDSSEQAAIRAVAASCWTRLVRHEQQVLVWLIGGWCVAMLVYVVLLLITGPPGGRD